jgi:DNA-binding response OmpR family regulator
LLVDTELRVLHDFAEALRCEGYDVLPATSFQEGKRLWMHHHPGVLVVDVRLGEFNGLQLLMRARADRPDLHAIITCPFADPVLEAEARRFGGDFLVKPIDPMQIVAAIERSMMPHGSNGGGATLWTDRDNDPAVSSIVQLNASGHYAGSDAGRDERRRGERRQLVNREFRLERRRKDRRSPS